MVQLFISVHTLTKKYWYHKLLLYINEFIKHIKCIPNRFYQRFYWVNIPIWEGFSMWHSYITTNTISICECTHCLTIFGGITKVKFLHIINLITYLFRETSMFKGNKSIYRVTIPRSCGESMFSIIWHFSIFRCLWNSNFIYKYRSVWFYSLHMIYDFLFVARCFR